MTNLEHLKHFKNPEKAIELENKLMDGDITPEVFEVEVKKLELWAEEEAIKFKSETGVDLEKIEQSSHLPEDEIKEVESTMHIADNLEEVNQEANKITRFDRIKDKASQFLKVAAGVVGLAALPNNVEGQAPKERGPIVVHDKKDNRLKAYKDSLTLYNNFIHDSTLIKNSDIANRYGISLLPNKKNIDLNYLEKNDQTNNKPVNKKIKPKDFLGYRRTDVNPKYKDTRNPFWESKNPVGILIDDRKGNDNYDDNSYYIPKYQKPKQKVEYKPEEAKDTASTPEVEEGKEFFKYYDNKAEYEKALQEYNDSLDAYNQEEEIRRAITKNGDKNTEIPGTLRYLTKKDKVPESIKMRYKVMPTKIVDYMIGDKRLHTWLYDKPLAIPKLRESKSLGSINVHGRKIEYTSEEQKNEILQKLKEHNISASKVGDSENYTVTRFQEKTKGWQGNKLLDETGAVLIDLDK
jgi:hypothetical protein